MDDVSPHDKEVLAIVREKLAEVEHRVSPTEHPETVALMHAVDSLVDLVEKILEKEPSHP